MSELRRLEENGKWYRFNPEAFKEAVLKQVKVKNIIIQPLGPIIGASSGPGTIIVNYRGK